ncbi:putative disease resistance RPP8-like protein 4 [Vitis vinifera]|uniref:Putative disease resistance RPP8-like protein 4 n=1 Tax=Vitis vinifera TaxID=29760 RepID=A0A438I3P0_VITVI|nr:putative disease resistance RPP8-like protein 4 [Vitis vinifera]
MAESIVTVFLEKLTDLLSQEAFLLSRVEEQVNLLSIDLEWMRQFLKDADAKRRYDPRIKLWVSQIRDVTYDAEDVIDRFMFEMNHQQQGSLKCLKFLKLRLVHKLESRIREINTKIEKIKAAKSTFIVETLPAASWPNEVVPHRERRAPIVEEVNVVGIQEDAKSVKQKLLNGEMRRAVVSIVGMGGLGKTTLAKKVYNDNDVQQCFDCHAWIYVSQEYTIRELLLGVAVRVGILSEEERSKMNESDLGNSLRDYLTTKKYLIVMDDMWRNEAWDRLGLYFPDSVNGSRVLITSRNKQIGLYADPQTIPHELSFLTEEESWELFLKKIFLAGSANAVCPRELEELGKKIVANCGGLPLAIVVLGGLLSRKEKTPLSWQKVLDSLTWHLNQGPDSCLGVLALSYNDMPYYLKSCFLYCGLFPEDSEIRTDKLIRLWVAEGFIQRRGEEIAEDVAEDHLQELVHRSMIQVAARSFDGRVMSCRMHDLLRDLAISEAKDTKFFEGYESIDSTSPVSVRRLTIHQENILRSLHRRVKLLTVLDLERMPINTIPEGIGELIHLKYLCLRRTRIKRLPSSIGRLTNLQTLDFQSTFIEIIPSTIWKLHHLRHLYGRGVVSSQSVIDKCRNGPLSVDHLTNLQSLGLRAGSWCCGEGLGKLTELRELIIEWTKMAQTKNHGFSESVKKLTALQSLRLYTLGAEMFTLPHLMPFSDHTYLYHLSLRGRLERFPDEIEFYPPNLISLELECWNIEQDPMVTLEKLPNLRFLILSLCYSMVKKMVCTSGGFQQLETLTLWGLKELEELIVEEGAMPDPKDLVIETCPKMKRLSHGLLQRKNLQHLKLYDLSPELMDELSLIEGEDREKICLATSIHGWRRTAS